MASRLRCGKWQISFFLGAAGLPLSVCATFFIPLLSGDNGCFLISAAVSRTAVHTGVNGAEEISCGETLKDLITSLETFVLFFI